MFAPQRTACWSNGRGKVGESTIEELDAAIYGYIARLNYDDVMIARPTTSAEVHYLVATATDDHKLGQQITVVVGGITTENTLATYQQVRNERDR